MYPALKIDVTSCNDLGSASAERAGQGEVGGCTQRVQTAWASQGPALEMLSSNKLPLS